ncbi:MAG: glycosyltransferase [Veillonellaceae bacterium]|nr:glycosyltransferase [Veillonellaceae bacterium]
MNLKALRKDFSTQSLLDLARHDYWVYYDQDILNKVCLGRIKLLDVSWNCLIHSSFSINLIRCALRDVFLSYVEARKQPKIIHYTSGSAPCRNLDRDLPEYFWKYARQSVWYEELVGRYVELKESVKKG